MKIRYLERDDIDTAKWNKCVANSVNGIVYAYTWYLDIVAENWAGLVADDYRAVFPIPYNKKYGIGYVYQPFFSQQLGLFSVDPISKNLVNEFLKKIPKGFKYIAISLNTFLKADLPNCKVTPRTTYHLDLISPYPVLSSHYSTNTQRNISKSIAYNITVVRGLSAFQLIELKRENPAVRLKQKHYDILKQLITQSVGNGVGELYGAYTSHNQLCAGALFLKSNGKVIYLLASTSEEGRDQRAMFALVDHYIKQNSESNLVFDFEGSSIPSVARFYSGFGASPCEYNHIVINRLPWFLKLFK
jgi:hypothetical protein